MLVAASATRVQRENKIDLRTRQTALRGLELALIEIRRDAIRRFSPLFRVACVAVGVAARPALALTGKMDELGVRAPLIVKRDKHAASTAVVISAVACCGIVSWSLAWFGATMQGDVEETVLATSDTSSSKIGKILPPNSIDFFMGILLRMLALVAVVLAVVEIQLPSIGSCFARGKETEECKPCQDDSVEVRLTARFLDENPKDTSTTTSSWEWCAYIESALLIVAYMAASIGIVYMNAYILQKWPYAATLTMVQMIFCSVASHACVCAGMTDPSKVGMTARLYLTICVPLAALYTLYLYGSNAVYSYLPVGYIQLLKPAQAIAVYILLAAAGCESVTWASVLNLLVILGSVVIASVAQSEIAGWSTLGFVLMMVSNAAYACYLVGQQLMLNTRLGSASGKKSVKMDSISTLYFLGPPTACGLALVAFANEWRNASFTSRGMPGLLVVGDCFIAFSLNLIQIRIIGKLSALTYMFSGYVKGFMTVAISWVFYHEAVDQLEIGGYVVMLFGQLLWSLRKLRNRPVDKKLPDHTATAPPAASKATTKTNAAIASVALLAVLVYAAAGNRCILVPCRG